MTNSLKTTLISTLQQRLDELNAERAEINEMIKGLNFAPTPAEKVASISATFTPRVARKTKRKYRKTGKYSVKNKSPFAEMPGKAIRDKGDRNKWAWGLSKDVVSMCRKNPTLSLSAANIYDNLWPTYHEHHPDKTVKSFMSSISATLSQQCRGRRSRLIREKLVDEGFYRYKARE